MQNLLKFAFVQLILSAASLAAQDSKPAAPEYTKDELIQMAKEVEADVADLRGWKFKRPVKVDVRNESELRAFIEKRLFEEDMGNGKLEKVEAFLRLVGLIPKDCDLRKTMMDVLLNQVGGFYDPKTQAFYMLQRTGVSYGPFVNRILIAHELTHALDDQYMDLDRLMKSQQQTEDWSLAIGAVVEGSATQLMTAYSAKAMEGKKYDTAELTKVAQDEMRRSQAFLEAPPYFRTLIATYLCGMFFVVKGEMADIAGINPQAIQKNMLALAADPPQSSEQVLHPLKYWDKSKRDEPVRFDDDAIERVIAPQGWSVVHRDTLGEVFCAQLASDPDAEFNMMVAANPRYWTNDAAMGWGGDRLYLLARGTNQMPSAAELRDAKCVWITAWDTSIDRNEFIEDFKARRKDSSRRDWTIGDRVTVFAFGFSDAEFESMKTALTTDKLGAKSGKKTWSAKAE